MPEDNEINLEQDLEDGILKAVGQTEKKPSKKLSDDDLDENEKKVLVHSSLDDTVVGQVIELKEDFAKTRFRATKDMTYDPEGLVFNAFVYTAASWAAQLAINKEFLITASSKCNFLSPIKVGDVVNFEANAFFSESKKQEVRVTGYVNEIQVFDGSFAVLILEDHILRIQKRQVEKQAKESRDLRASRDDVS